MEQAPVTDWARLQAGRRYWLRSPSGPIYEATFTRAMHASGTAPGPVEFEVHSGRYEEPITLSPGDGWVVFESHPKH